MSNGRPEGFDTHFGRYHPCACGDTSHRNRRRVKREAAKWLRLQWKKYGEFATNKLRYRPHYC